MLKRDPFIPFTVHLTDGTAHPIQSQSDVWMTMLTLHVGFDLDENGLFRNTVYFSPSHVSRLVPIVEAKAS